MKALGEIPFLVQILEIVARVPFLVVTSLAVDYILGTNFLDRHVKAILPPQRKVVLHDAPPVALVGTARSRHDRKMAPGAPRNNYHRPINPNGGRWHFRPIHRHGRSASSEG